ncbi:hypothetical protein NUM3379_36400 [Kineococcus sp. NUM-3379]
MAHDGRTRAGRLPAARADPRLRRLLLALGFAAACWLARTTATPTGVLAVVWPAVGVAFLWFATSWGRPRQVALDCVLALALATLVNALTGAPPVLAVLFAGSGILSALVACAAFRRLAGDPGWPLRRPVHLWALLTAAVVGAAAGAAVGGVVAAAAGVLTVQTLLQGVGAWVLRSTVGTVVVAAAGLRLADAPPWLPRGRRAVELAVVGVLLAAGYGAVFGMGASPPLSFVLLPLSVWVGARFGATVTALHVLLVGTAVVVLTHLDHGPFAAVFDADRVLVAQSYLLVLALVSLPVALHRDERQALIDRLHAAAREAEEQAGLLDAVIRSTADGIVVLGADGRVVLHNPRSEELTGHRAQVVDLSRPAADHGWFRPDGSPVPQRERPMARALAGEEVTDSELLVRHAGCPQGRILSVSVRPLPGPPGEHAVVAVLHDVTDARRAAEEVRDARDRLAAVLAAATDQAIIATDPEGRVTLFNEGARRMLGYTESEVLGRTPVLWHDPAEIAHRAGELGIEPRFSVLVQEAVQGRAGTGAWTFVRRDGHRLQARVTVSAMRDTAGAITGFMAIAADVTEQWRAEQALAESEQRFRLAFETAPVGMALASLDRSGTGRLLQVNEALCGLTGRGPQELLGTDVAALGGEGGDALPAGALADLAAGRAGTVRAELRFARPDGTVAWGACAVSALPHTGGEPQLILIVEDVTGRREAEQVLTRQALHDTLTGLPNRALLADRLEHALSETARSGLRTGLLYLDLDGFKAVNDSAGHAAGDELLVQVAERLQGCVRPGDTVTRLGGDEFAVVCPGIAAAADLVAVAARALEVVRQPYRLRGGTFTVSASVGATVAGPGDAAGDVVHVADEAMYEAKRAGKDRIVTRDAAQPGRPASVRLLQELRTALAEDQLVLHGQPIVDLETGAVVAVEVLLRWHHPERGLLPPVEFLPEAGPLMPQLGRRVLAEACRLAAGWQELLGAAAPLVHVNVSSRELESQDLADDVLDALQRYSLPPDRLVLEVTETLAPLLVEALGHDVRVLRERGVRFAVDDLGTGSSSLARLSELPVDVLKVDARFVAGLGAEAGCDAVVRAIVGVGRALGPVVVAEGVQTPQQAELLRRYRCERAQGHLFSSPRPEGELVALLREWPLRAGFAPPPVLDLRGEEADQLP